MRKKISLWDFDPETFEKKVKLLNANSVLSPFLDIVTCFVTKVSIPGRVVYNNVLGGYAAYVCVGWTEVINGQCCLFGNRELIISESLINRLSSIDVHGGVTYNEIENTDNHMKSHLWVGWDYMHFGDAHGNYEGYVYELSEIMDDVEHAAHQIKDMLGENFKSIEMYQNQKEY